MILVHDEMIVGRSAILQAKYDRGGSAREGFDDCLDGDWAETKADNMDNNSPTSRKAYFRANYIMVCVHEVHYRRNTLFCRLQLCHSLPIRGVQALHHPYFVIWYWLFMICETTIKFHIRKIRIGFSANDPRDWQRPKDVLVFFLDLHWNWSLTLACF